MGAPFSIHTKLIGFSGKIQLVFTLSEYNKDNKEERRIVMEENKKIDSEEVTIVQEKPKKKANAALILGIIGTSVGVLALLLIVGGFFFRGARSNMMDDMRENRSERIEDRSGFGNDGNFNRGSRR